MPAPLAEIRAIFFDALDCQDAIELGCYLDRACQNKPDLRGRVEALLRAHKESGAFLQAATDEGHPSDRDGIPEKPGSVLGPYKLLEQIGEGGFGVVFLAEQQAPIRRKVALKVLKSGMDSRQIVARFEAERQALALMDHPNIAKVLDAGEIGGVRSQEPGASRKPSNQPVVANEGARQDLLSPDSCLLTPSPRPFFAMELVRGVPITNYCDANNLCIEERLKLFQTVCQAVQHAHQKGIIHRDIKPTNILVTLHDGVPVPKVIDFGIAKALGQQLTDKTLFTGFAQLVGTPLYMSPEQAEMSGLDVDTRSDIYSLGVLLYELLTGTTPFDKERLSKAAYDEMRRIIREEDPATPSTRLSTLGAAATVVSARRQSDPVRLRRLIRGELDWIVMKALEKERGRRYDTAGALVAEVQRYLNGEAVLACPPSTWYRFRKYAGRHKTGLTAAVLVTLALVVGTVVSTWQAIRATASAASEQQAWLDLEKEQQATQHELGRVQKAEGRATRELFESLVAQARANRLSRRVGQRFQTLAILNKATALARKLALPPKRFLELRNEAIAALALPDMQPFRDVPYMRGSWNDFDAACHRYAVADASGDVIIRSVKDGAEIARLAGPRPGAIGVKFSPDAGYLAVIQRNDRRAEIWKLDDKKPARIHFQLVAETDGNLRFKDEDSLCFSADSGQVALQHPDGWIDIFDLTKGNSVRRFAKAPTVHGLSFVAKYLGLAYEGAAQVLDAESGKVIWQQKVHAGWPFVTWHPDGKTLTVADDEAIYLWDMTTQQQVGKIRSSQGTNCAFNSTGRLLASGGWDQKVHLWDTLTNRELFSTWAYAAMPLHFSPDGLFLAATEHGNSLRIWEIAREGTYRTLTANPLGGAKAFVSCQISADGRLLAAGAGGGFGLWDLVSGKNLTFTDGWDSWGTQVLFAGSETLLTMSPDGMFRRPLRRHADTGSMSLGAPEKLPLPGADAGIAASADGKVLASAQYDGALVLYADQSAQSVHVGPHANVRTVDVSPDGRWVATGGYHLPGGVKVWNARTRALETEFTGGDMCYPVFSPDRKRLLTGNGLGEIRVWEVGTWTEAPIPEPLRGMYAKFSVDGKLLAVETGTGAVRLLDPQTGREYARLEDPNQDRSRCFAFTPDGARLVCSSPDGHCLHVWDLQALHRDLATMGLDWQ